MPGHRRDGPDQRQDLNRRRERAAIGNLAEQASTASVGWKLRPDWVKYDRSAAPAGWSTPASIIARAAGVEVLMFR